MMANKHGGRRMLMAFRLIAALAGAAAATIESVAASAGKSEPGNLAEFRVIADGIPEAIGGATGNAERGRALILGREAANCVLCHAVPEPGLRFSGNLGPPLGGVARTFSVAQLRLRVVDNMRVKPATIMPSYYRIEGFDQVAGAYRGKPILDAEQIEDIVAYLATLR
ncbi:MAG TPA: sulfur oxidation c-type cytochrome SoxX [Casimicrobiaceae bacterium]|nr:sulfur oxidation c-type cytochrome SoxX [Casimicrobiaceae bacterium]